MTIVPTYPSGVPTGAEWEDLLIGYGAGDGDGNLINFQSYANAEWYNKNKGELHRATIELGILPKGSHADVRTRLDYLEVEFEPLPSGLTPDINLHQHYIVSGVTRTISDFTNTQPSGHALYLGFNDGNTTINHNANIHLAGDVDYVSASGDALLLVWDQNNWKEVGRAVGSNTRYIWLDPSMAVPDPGDRGARSVVTFRFDSNNNVKYNRTFDWMTWYFYTVLPGNFGGFNTNGFEIDLRADDQSGTGFYIAMYDGDGNWDSAINGSLTQVAIDNTWETFQFNPGSTYLPGESIIVEIQLYAGSSTGRADFTGIKLTYTAI